MNYIQAASFFAGALSNDLTIAKCAMGSVLLPKIFKHKYTDHGSKAAQIAFTIHLASQLVLHAKNVYTDNLGNDAFTKSVNFLTQFANSQDTVSKVTMSIANLSGAAGVYFFSGTVALAGCIYVYKVINKEPSPLHINS